MNFSVIKFCLASVLAVLALTGCEPKPPKDPIIAKNEKWFILTDIRPPKHVYVSFREEGTGFEFKHLYVSKLCIDWRKLKLGSRWKLTEVVRQGKNGTYSELEGVRTVFCDQVRY